MFQNHSHLSQSNPRLKIGQKENTSIFDSFRNQKLTLRNPESNEVAFFPSL